MLNINSTVEGTSLIITPEGRLDTTTAPAEISYVVRLSNYRDIRVPAES